MPTGGEQQGKGTVTKLTVLQREDNQGYQGVWNSDTRSPRSEIIKFKGMLYVACVLYT